MPVTFIQSGRFGADVLMAYHQDWPAWGPTDETLNGSRIGPDSTALGGGYRLTAGLETSNGSDGKYWEWLFSVDAGTFTLTLLHTKYFEYGRFDVTIDGTSIGTLDLYAASAIYNHVTTFAGIVMSSGNHRLRFTAAGKNASATSYTFSLNWLSLTRTGA